MITLIKGIFGDVFLLYKNFFHFVLSKILIFLWSIILAFLFVLPFLLIFFIYGYFIGEEINSLFIQITSLQLGTDDFINSLLYVSVILFFIIYLYQYILLIKLNNEYKGGNKLAYFKNIYFDIKKIKRFFKINICNFVILIIPIVSFFIYILVLNLFFGNIELEKNIYFAILSLLGFLFFSLLYIYVFFRIIFSYFVFIDDENNEKKIMDYIKESYYLTRGYKKFIRFLVVILIFFTFLFPSKFILNNVERKVSDVSNFIIYNSLSEEDKSNLLGNNLYIQNTYYFRSLELEYSKYSKEVLNSKIRIYDFYIILLNIFNFVFLYGVMSMVFTSFYKRELIKNKY